MEEFKTEILIAIAAAVGSILTKTVEWIFKKRKNKLDLSASEIQNESSELDNIDKAAGIWRNVAEGLKNELISVREAQAAMFEQNQKLLKEMGELSEKNEKLTKHVTTLERKVQGLTNENKKLLEALKK